MDFLLSTQDIILAIIVTIIGSMLQGSVGFGLGPFAVPLLVLIDPSFIPGPLLLVAVFLTALMARREHHSIDYHGFKWAISGRVIGSILGAVLLSVFPKDKLILLFAAMVLLAVLLSAGGFRLALSSVNLVGAGTLSGFMGTVSSIGGAPMALIYQHNKGPELRGTLSAIFVAGTIIALTALAFVGRLGVKEIQLGLVLMPGIFIGFYLSRFTVKFLDRGFIRPAILIVSTLAALVLFIEYFFI